MVSHLAKPCVQFPATLNGGIGQPDRTFVEYLHQVLQARGGLQQGGEVGREAMHVATERVSEEQQQPPSFSPFCL